MFRYTISIQWQTEERNLECYSSCVNAVWQKQAMTASWPAIAVLWFSAFTSAAYWWLEDTKFKCTRCVCDHTLHRACTNTVTRHIFCIVRLQLRRKERQRDTGKQRQEDKLANQLASEWFLFTSQEAGVSRSERRGIYLLSGSSMCSVVNPHMILELSQCKVASHTLSPDFNQENDANHPLFPWKCCNLKNQVRKWESTQKSESIRPSPTHLSHVINLQINFLFGTDIMKNLELN